MNTTTATPGIDFLGGVHPVLAGTRFKVRILVEYFRSEPSIERFLEDFPHLNHEQVRAALDFYEAHRTEIDEEIERLTAETEEIRKAISNPSTREKLVQRYVAKYGTLPPRCEDG